MERVKAVVRHMGANAFLLAAFAVISTALVAVTHVSTRDQVEANERAELLATLHALVPAENHDNDMYQDRIEVTDALLGTSRPVIVYRGFHGGKPVAAILNPVAPDGYSGDIRLLVAVRADGTLAGVRVLAHKETPGLGDLIEAERSDWITRFTGKSLENPAPAGWKVKKDGGEFDQFTGATITPRAVVKAVHNTLLFTHAHRDDLFATRSDQPQSSQSAPM